MFLYGNFNNCGLIEVCAEKYKIITLHLNKCISLNAICSSDRYYVNY